MSLEEMLLRNELVREPANRGEIRQLLAAVDRRLDDARRVENHPETRIEQAYHGILGCATLALRLSGLRPTNILGKHQFVLESLKDTLAVEDTRVDFYQRAPDPEFSDEPPAELPSCRVLEARQPRSMKAPSTCPSMTSKKQSKKQPGSVCACATRWRKTSQKPAIPLHSVGCFPVQRTPLPHATRSTSEPKELNERF